MKLTTRALRLDSRFSKLLNLILFVTTKSKKRVQVKTVVVEYAMEE